MLTDRPTTKRTIERKIEIMTTKTNEAVMTEETKTPTMTDIEMGALALARIREHAAAEIALLNAKLAPLNEEIAKLKRPHVTRLRALSLKMDGAMKALAGLIDQARDLFIKPKSQTFHDIKLGLRKGTGGLVIQDEAKTVALVRKHFPDRFKELVRTVETPDKEAIAKLSGEELKKLGVHIAAAVDVVFVKPEATAVEKELQALFASVGEDSQN